VTVAPVALPAVTASAVAVPEPTTNEVAANASAAPEVFAPGKVTLVHFFASWCTPCVKSMPELDAIYKRHHGLVAVIGLSEDDDERDMRAFVATTGVVFTVLWDGAKAKASRWRPSTMPATYVVDKHGSTRFTHAGYRDGDGDALETEVQSLLAEH
jgi:thiol-disulfide isomerase/thioredoxin